MEIWYCGFFSGTVPRKASDPFEKILFAAFSYTREQGDERKTLTHLIAEGLSLTQDMFIEGQRNHRKWDSLYN